MCLPSTQIKGCTSELIITAIFIFTQASRFNSPYILLWNKYLSILAEKMMNKSLSGDNFLDNGQHAILSIPSPPLSPPLPCPPASVYEIIDFEGNDNLHCRVQIKEFFFSLSSLIFHFLFYESGRFWLRIRVGVGGKNHIFCIINRFDLLKTYSH